MKSKLFILSILVVTLQAVFAQSTVINPLPQTISTAADNIAKPKDVRIVGKSDADIVAVNLLQSLFR